MSPTRPELNPDSPAPQGQLSDAEFDSLRTLIYELTGISLNDSKRSLVEGRVARRLRANDLASYGEYCELVRSLPAEAEEVVELINCVTTNKTDFFREPHHFEFLRTRLFPELEARARKGGPRHVRLWSAACSSGEEPYTLAMTAFEHFAGKGWRIEILATDIDTDVLARAKAGVYPTERVDGLPSETVRRHFLRGKGRWAGHYKVRPELAQLVRFERLNFMDDEWGVEGRFDAIFCRNVVIYFDRRTQDALFRRLHTHLADEGYLMIGHSENLHFLAELFEPLPKTVHKKRAASRGLATPPPAMPARVLAAEARNASSAQLPRRSITIGEVFATQTPTVVRTLLGSCVAACLWDPIARVGGMNHILLPTAPGGEEHSSRFGVHAMELLINAVMQRGGERRRLRAKAFGAAHVLSQISLSGSASERNAAFVKQFLERESIPLIGARLGGNAPLEVLFQTHDGKAFVRPVPGNASADVAHSEHQYGEQIVRNTRTVAEPDITLF